MQPETRYARSGGLNIAYQVSGGGPLDLVLVSGWISHLELDWEEPRSARFLDRLGSFARLIRFDKRGTGLSDRCRAGSPTLETRMDDVRAVMDAVGSERAALFGFSEGGPMCAPVRRDVPGAHAASCSTAPSRSGATRTPTIRGASTMDERRGCGGDRARLGRRPPTSTSRPSRAMTSVPRAGGPPTAPARRAPARRAT